MWPCDLAYKTAIQDQQHTTLEHAAFTKCKFCGQKHHCEDQSRIPCEEFAARQENVKRLRKKQKSWETIWLDSAVSGEKHYQAVDRLERNLGYAKKVEHTYKTCTVCKGTGRINKNDTMPNGVQCGHCIGTKVEPA